MALYRDVHSRIAVRDRFADDNEYAAELVQVGWMTGESRREVVPKSRWSPSCEFLFRIPNLIIDHAPTRNWNSALLFIMLAISFGFIYIIYLASTTSIGILLGLALNKIQILIKIIFFKVQSKSKKQKTHFQPWLEVTKPKFEHFILSIFGFFILASLIIENPRDVLPLLLSVFSSAILWSILLKNQETTKLIDNSIIHLESKQKELDNLKHGWLAVLFLFLFTPAILSGAFGTLLNGSMKFINLRKDVKAIHIQSPYYELVTGVTNTTSPYGKDYKQFGESTILFSGFGKSTVLCIKNSQSKSDKCPRFIFPSEAVKY